MTTPDELWARVGYAARASQQYPIPSPKTVHLVTDVRAEFFTFACGLSYGYLRTADRESVDRECRSCLRTVEVLD